MPTQQDWQNAVATAIGFFAGSREPFALLWLDVMHRRFGIPPFADALRRFDQVLAERPDELPLLRVFRRMADRDNPLRLEDLDAVTHPSDRLVVCALYCDRLGLSPSFFAEMLDKAANAGGYYLTHALLAVIWMREYGGDVELPAAFVENLYRANAALISADARTVSDMKLEAAAFLHFAGQGARVDRTFVESVLLTQQRDGGWGKSHDGRSDWHATILALLLLLHVRHDPQSIRDMTAPRFRHATIVLGFDTGPDSRLLVNPNGEFTTGNLPLRQLIGFAYDRQDAEITGPESLDSERYSIAAQAEAAVPDKDIGRFRLMARALLAERFELEFHWETQRIRAFALDRVADVLVAKQAAASEPGPILEVRGPSSIRVSNAPMAPLFTSWLSTRLGARILNRTGLLGPYTFDLAWEGEPTGQDHEPLEAALRAQLGLALEALDADVERLVVDRVARPADLQPRPVAIEIDTATLDRYVGRYSLPGASVMTVSRDGARLFAAFDRQDRIEIFAASATEFFPKVFQARIEFLVDERGRATALVLRQGGRDVQAPRVADAG